MFLNRPVLAVVSMFAALLFFSGCNVETFSKKKNSDQPIHPAAVLFRIGGSLPTFPETGGFLPSVSLSQLKLERLLQRAASDVQVNELVVYLGAADLSMARASELAVALKRFAQSGKPVTCHLDYADNITYWIAVNGCPRILLSPAGGVEALGISMEAIFFKDFLASFGIAADLLSVGKYKDASEPLMRDGMSPASRAAGEELIGELHRLFVDGIVSGRKIKKEKVQDLLDTGPFDAKQSVELGLVDEIAPLGGFLETLRDKYKGGVIDDYGKSKPKPFSVTDLFKLFGKQKDEDQKPSVPHVAILPIIGPINSGYGEDLFENMEMVKDGEVVKALGELGRDASVKSVVLRIDSPGGSALASDNIWHAVQALREKKPVVASLGDVAASGGYYIAAGANEILASPSTLTGSIGVLGGKIVFGEGAAKLGIKTERISFGKRTGMLSPFQPFSDDERVVIQKMMQGTYDLFVDRVVQGRSLDRNKVLEAAEGRVWTGTQAMKIGLVDGEGGLQEAIARARELGQLPKDAPVEIFPPPKNVMEMLGEAFAEPEDVVSKTLAKRHSTLGRALVLTSLLLDHNVLTFSPILFEVR